jgi:hypothetical protein
MKRFNKKSFTRLHKTTTGRGSKGQTTVGREICTRGNPMASKIQNPMAKGRGKKHQILP